MNAQADVLAVMDALISLMHQGPIGVHGANEARDAVAALIAERDALREASTRLVDEVDGLVDESGGGYGLHLNGDMSPWGEILPGGQFERLTSLDDLRAALARAQGVQP